MLSGDVRFPPVVASHNARGRLGVGRTRRPVSTELLVEICDTMNDGKGSVCLGTVSLHDVKYEGHRIHPTVKESLLTRDEFDEVNLHMRPFINKMLAQDQGELL